MPSLPSVPLLIIQGGADEQIPVATTQILDNHLCSLQANVERWIYPGLHHYGVIAVSTNDMVAWMTQRFAGTKVLTTPAGVPGVQVENCQLSAMSTSAA